MENTRHARNLVLISKHPEDAPFCAAVCETAGLSLEHFETVDQAFASDSSGNRVALVVDVGAESDHRRLKTALSSLANAGKTLNPEAIYYVTDLPIDQAAFLIVGSSACNYVLRNFKDPIEAGRLYGRLLSNTLNGTSLELATLLSGGAAIETLKPGRSVEKQGVVDSVLGFLGTAGFHPRIAEKIANAADELLMNAMFDAPVGADGRPMHVNTPRTADIPLEGRQTVEMQVGCDGTYAAILVTDRFGSLNPDLILTKLARTYADKSYVPTSDAGAGLGIFSVFQSGGSLYFRVRKGARTDALAFFRKTDTYREFREQFRFFTLRPTPK